MRETIERRRAAEQAAEHLRPHAARAHRPEPASARASGAGRGPRHARRRPDSGRRPLHLPAQPRSASGRRTVEITGRPRAAAQAPASAGAAAGRAGAAPAHEPANPARSARRRPSPSPAERLAHRPDRIAAWAVVLGFAMMVIAAL